jgi:tryptophan-rich sensory protein
MNYTKLFKLLFSIIICELAGAIGSVFTISQVKTWYLGLVKPEFNPPSWIFGPVWTTLFVLMGISLYLVWNNKWRVKNEINFKKTKVWNKYSQKFMSGSWQKLNIILIFAVQLALNVLWSVIFFTLHNPGVAFFELIMLWFAIIYTIVNFWRVSKASAWLLLPYLLWVSFAGILNCFIWILN